MSTYENNYELISYSKKDFESCDDLDYYDGEFGEYFEGDMMLTQEQMQYLEPEELSGLIGKKFQWPNKTLIYKFTRVYTAKQKEIIRNVANLMSSFSCVNFKEHTTEGYYLEISVCFQYMYSFEKNQRKFTKPNIRRVKKRDVVQPLDTVAMNQE